MEEKREGSDSLVLLGTGFLMDRGWEGLVLARGRGLG